MTDKAAERVLVVPTSRLHALGVFQGFTPHISEYLPALLDPTHLRYLPRSQVETDPTFKQLIPYVVLRWRDQVFHYTRGAAGTETRLRALRSVGIGGHISEQDGSSSGDPYRTGLLREIAEEVVLHGEYTERAIGLINDDRTPVGQVHLGVVHVLDLLEPQVHLNDEALRDGAFASPGELRACRAEFESWSQLLLDGEWLQPLPSTLPDLRL